MQFWAKKWARARFFRFGRESASASLPRDGGFLNGTGVVLSTPGRAGLDRCVAAGERANVETDPKTMRVWQIIEPVALDAGLELVDVEHRREGRGTVLRLLMDKPGGVSLEELARVSREVSDVLDSHAEAVPGAYTLEVSSPGINRPLTRPAHFTAFVGKRVYVRTRVPIAGRQSFRGVLTSVGDEGIVVTSDDTQPHPIAFDAIARAQYQHEFTPGRGGRALPRRPARRAGQRSGAR